MRPVDAQRLARLGRDVAELGVAVALLPLRLIARRLLPPAPEHDPRHWAPVGDGDAATDAPAADVAAGPPWPDYDALTVAQVRARLAGADADTKAAVRAYEAAHKARKGVLGRR